MPSHQKLTADVSTIGIDIGKTTFHLIGQNRFRKVVMRARLSRSQLMECLVNVPHCLIGMEDNAVDWHYIARLRINAWRDDYNIHRPHSALGNLTPSALADQLLRTPERSHDAWTRNRVNSEKAGF